jgi:hypothetical protein
MVHLMSWLMSSCLMMGRLATSSRPDWIGTEAHRIAGFATSTYQKPIGI